MSECIKVVIEADKGATVRSPNFFSIEELVPPSTTVGDIEDGIDAGTYTPVDLDLYSYEGKAQGEYGLGTVITLNPVVTTVTTSGDNEYKVVSFKIPPATTNQWENKEQSFFFDIKRTLLSDTTEVDVWVKGTIHVSPVITE